jgi:integrase/recombinase XerD
MTTHYVFASPLAPVITRYVDLMTALGRSFATQRRVLALLDAFLVAEHASELTLEVFEGWCRTQAHLKSGIQRAQMHMVRHLCLYRRRTEPTCFVPDPAGFPPGHQYASPYILSEDEITRLLVTAHHGAPTAAAAFRAQALYVGVVLLYTAGLRRGELLRLTLGDYDLQAQTLLIQASKFHKSRLLPLSPAAVQVLDTYLAGRRARRPDTTTRAAPLIWKGGTAVRGYSGVRWSQRFHALARQAGVLTPAGQPPRVHDLRHTFAVHALLRWYRAGVDVQAKLPFLSTYMGHVSMVSTEYYLHFVEPVAHAASARFAQQYGALLTPHTTEEHP